jgi:hypothetical protein
VTAPTVSSLLPAVGHTGGRCVTALTGTGFNLPPPPSPTGVVPDPIPTVSVTFNGVPALDVAVQDSTLIYALTPISPTYTLLPSGQRDWGPGFVDVVVQNLDPLTGLPVPGESVTLTSAFEYRRPDLSAESHATTTFACFMAELARQVCPTVDYARHTDWSDGGASIDLGQIAKMPALLVVDMEMQDSVQRPQGPQAVDYGDGNFARVREPEAVDIVGTIIGVAETTVEIQNMALGAKLFFKKNARLAVPRSSTALDVQTGAYDTSGGTISYTIEFQITDPIKFTAGGNNSNVKTFAFAYAIRGVLIESWPGVMEQGVSDTPATLPHESTTGITVVADNGVEMLQSYGQGDG